MPTFTPFDIAFLVLFVSFVSVFALLGRAWSVIGIISTYVIATIAPVAPFLQEQSPRSAGLFVIIVGCSSTLLRRRLLRGLKSSSIGTWIAWIPLSIIAGGFLFSEMLRQLPSGIVESLSYGVHSLFTLPSARIIWRVMPLLLLLLLRTQRPAIAPPMPH